MKKILMVLCVLAICTSSFAEEKKTDEQGKLEKEKPDYRSVIVDAWLVRINAESLAKSGVKLFSEKEKENVSIMNLLWCLNEPNSGKIMASARTQSNNNESAECESEKCDYIKQEQVTVINGEPHKSVTFTPYTSSTNFKSTVQIREDKKILLQYVFKANDFITSDSNAPAGKNCIQFVNIINLSDKRAVIAAQSQTGNDMFFLVMKAEIVE